MTLSKMLLSGDNLTCPSTFSQCYVFSKEEIDIFFNNMHNNAALSALNEALDLFKKYFYLGTGILFLMLMFYVVYKIYFDPLCYAKELSEVGFDHIPPGPDRPARIARAQALRRVGTKIPPPYPNGWFAVAESRDLKKGGVKSVDVLGQNLCVYRGEDGVARVVDAYCPHLGANLGVGGSVRGNCIECPFHKWKFNAEGTCVAVPGLEQGPRGVSLKTWKSVEADGALWIWYDAEGRAPLWQLEDAPECVQWGFRGRNEYIVSAHIQEIPENGADVAHLNMVNSQTFLTYLGEKYPHLYELIGYHVWKASWAGNIDHTASMALTHNYKLFGYRVFHSELEITQNGPGHVRLRLQTPLGPFMFSQSVTPIGPLLQKVVHRLYSPAYNAFAARPLILGEGKMIERDVKIWNSKTYNSNPPYLKTDKMIRAFRSWFSQFYSYHSITFQNAMQNPLDW